MLNKLILFLMQIQLNKFRKKNWTTTYIFIKGKGKDYPKYLMYTDNEGTRKEMQNIY
ncbi:hypothetical protein Clo1100_3722 [Clostridium sp. BNL1100]|nr:hypothetical protein Clo1100_3722 [Clostridium sp. BNL1100]